MNFRAANQDQSFLEVDFDLAGSKYGRLVFRRSILQAAQRDAKTGEQLADGKGLVDEVIGARIESGNFLILIRSYRKHDDRKVTDALAYLPDNFDSITVGQAQIQKNRVGLPFADSRKTFSDRSRFAHAIFFSSQRRAQESADFRIIL